MTVPDYTFETDALARGYGCIAGLDEVGRGPLAGPVVAAAVVLDPARIPQGMNDSKKLSKRVLERLYDEILATAHVGLGEASVAEIDAHNILRASHLAMERALAALPVKPDYSLIDGHMIPRDWPIPAGCVVKGDSRVLSIAAASIVAKVVRDRAMVVLSQQHPGYGWEKNVGYPTKSHRQALLDLGVTPHHRRSFGPVHKILCQGLTVSD